MPFAFARLPPALQDRILSAIPVRELAPLACVCQQWAQALAPNSQLWKSVFACMWGTTKARYRTSHCPEVSWKSAFQLLHTTKLRALGGIAYDYRGVWHSPNDGHRLTFRLRLRVAPSTTEPCASGPLYSSTDTVRLIGTFSWYMVHAPIDSPLRAAVTGTVATRVRAIEYVRGVYMTAHRLMLLHGTARYGAPIVQLDQYRLMLSPDGHSFEGMTRGYPVSWRERISGSTYILQSVEGDVAMDIRVQQSTEEHRAFDRQAENFTCPTVQ